MGTPPKTTLPADGGVKRSKIRNHVVAAAGGAGESDRFPVAHRDRHAVEHALCADGRCVFDDEIVDLQEGFAADRGGFPCVLWRKRWVDWLLEHGEEVGHRQTAFVSFVEAAMHLVEGSHHVAEEKGNVSTSPKLIVPSMAR
jgi:hypothetical protein